MEFFRPYGVAAKIRAPMVKAGSDDLAASADWTPATGDVKVSKDGGAIANVGTLPAVISSSAMWEFTLSATEMEADEITVTVIDSATKAVKDTAFSIRTTIPGALRVRKAQGADDSTHVTLDASASETDDLYNACAFAIIGGTGAGQSAVITDYVGSTKKVTLDRALAVTPDNTSIFAIFPQGIVGLSAAQVAAAVLNAETASHTTSGTVGKAIGDINTKAASLTFTVAGHVDANIQRINDVAVTGNGATPKFGV